MPASPPHPSPPDHPGDATSTTEGHDVAPGEDVRYMDLFQNQGLFLSTSSTPELNEEETQKEEAVWSQDGDRRGCGRLERRWLLWHEFMKEHAQLDTWLRLVEQAVGSPNLVHLTYLTAREEVRRFERLRCEAGPRLVQLDDLTQRNRTLTRLFQGAMQRRLLASARESGLRWDDVNAQLESVTARLKMFVSEWEEFEAEREELAFLLADLDVRLTEVDHLTGNTCEKLRRLQSFQQCVCVNSGRVNALLRRGEDLIQRSQPADAQHLESRLLELLRRCSLVYNNIARTHTRLLSMRLVFEDDWILSQATDSGCPSESLLEEEGALDKAHLDLPAKSSLTKALSSDPPSPVHLPPPPPSPSLPTHEHLGLEWDPSVDIGRSLSRDDADSSYFSASTGLCHRDGLKRRSYLSSLSSLGSQSDTSHDHQEADPNVEGWRDHAHSNFLSPVEAPGGGTRLNGDQWLTSTPGRQDGEPISFDGGRVRAWLGVESPAPPEGRTSCSKAVQTDGEWYREERLINTPSNQCRRDALQQPTPAPVPSPSHDWEASSYWMKKRQQSNVQAEEEQLRCDEDEPLLSEQSVTTSRGSPSSWLSPAVLYLLLAAAITLLACLIWVSLETPCHRSSRMTRGFHLTLRYVNGPPPT